MHKLKNTICYLSGPMEASKDGGVIWRREIIKKFEKHDLNIKCIDPTNKPGGNETVQEEKDYMEKLKKEDRWFDLVKYVKAFVRLDLRYLDLSDFIIIAVDKNTHMCGSYHEIVQAQIQKKPRFAIVNGGKRNMPTWLFSIINPNDVFDTLDDCVQRIIDLDNGKLPLDDKWVLIRDYV